MYEELANSIGHFTTCYICTVLINCKLLNRNEYFKIKNIAIIFCAVPLLRLTNNMMMSYKIACVIMIYTVVIRLIYKKGFLISLITCIFSYSIVFLCDAVNSLMYLKVFNIDIIYIQVHLYLTYIMYLSFFIISLISSFFINPKNYFIDMEDFILKKDLKSVFQYIIFFISYMSILGYIISVQPYLSLQHILSITVLCIFILMNFTYFRQIKISTKNKYEYDNISNYTAEIEKIANQLTTQEHEYKNRLIGIQSLIENKQYDEAVIFIKNILDIKGTNNTTLIANYDKVTDTVLREILINKTGIALSKGIKVNADIRNNISDLNISKIELNDMISIIMDNAIEAAVKSKQKEIDIMIYRDGEETSIIVANTYPREYTEVALYREGSSSKGQGRGRGLFILNQIEENNSQVTVDTAITEDLFIQEISISNIKETS